MKKILAALLIAATVTAFSFASAADYAKFKGITGTSENEENNPASDMIDGYDDTRWGAMQAGDIAEITLDAESTIESIDLQFYRGGVRNHEITVESSTDGKNWTPVAMAKTVSVADESLQPADKPDVAADGGYWDNFPLSSPVTAQYWRINFIGRYAEGTTEVDESLPFAVWETRFILASSAAAATPEIVVEPMPMPTVDPVENAPAPTPVVTSPVVNAPQTADPMLIFTLGTIISGISAGGVVLFRRNKK